MYVYIVRDLINKSSFVYFYKILLPIIKSKKKEHQIYEEIRENIKSRKTTNLREINLLFLKENFKRNEKDFTFLYNKRKEIILQECKILL